MGDLLLPVAVQGQLKELLRAVHKLLQAVHKLLQAGGKLLPELLQAAPVGRLSAML